MSIGILPSSITTISNAGSPQQIYLRQTTLQTPQNAVIANIFAMTESMPQNAGFIYRAIQTKNLTPPIAPVPPGSQGGASQPLTFNVVDISLQQYAMNSYMDTFNLQTNQIDIQQETVKHIGLALMQAEDIIQFNSLTSGLNQINASQGGNQDFPTNFSFNDALTITGYLTLNDTPYIYEPISGSDKFGTTPGRPAYGGLTPAALRPSFQADTSFVETPYYGESIYSGQEIGRLGNIVLNTSKNIPIFQDASVNGNPIYQTIVTGANAYMELHLDGVDKVLMQNGAAFTGPNALQMVANGRNIYGTGIVQPTWCVNVLSTAGINPAI